MEIEEWLNLDISPDEKETIRILSDIILCDCCEGEGLCEHDCGWPPFEQWVMATCETCEGTGYVQ